MYRFFKKHENVTKNLKATGYFNLLVQYILTLFLPMLQLYEMLMLAVVKK